LWRGCSGDTGARLIGILAGGELGVAAFEDGASRISGLGDVAEVEGRLGSRGGPSLAARRGVLEVLAHTLGLIFVDGTGVRLAAHSDGFKRIENGSALHFQFTRQIVDSNFVHPSLFRFPI
jgi:hypothetical protein